VDVAGRPRTSTAGLRGARGRGRVIAEKPPRTDRAIAEKPPRTDRRIFFRYDRRLLGELPRLAWQTVLEVSRAVLDRRDVCPGMVSGIHTFGQLVHFHPHIHALTTDGAFAPDGTFIPLPELDPQPYENLWRKKVFDLLLNRGKIHEALVTQMLGWQHSGFDVNFAVRLGPDDGAGRERLAQYMLRCPFSLQRLIRLTAEGKVIYLAEKNAPHRFPNPASPVLFGGVARNFQVFDPLDFIAELTQHIPEPRKHLVRYFGWYSNKTRGLRAKTTVTATGATDPGPTPAAPTARRRWAALIKRIWQVDPLACPRCGGPMKIVSFINPKQRDVIDRILDHCGLSSRDPPAEARGPPEPSIHKLTYVSDLEFVDDPGPAEPVWSAD
jgi:hypothetical protein